MWVSRTRDKKSDTVYDFGVYRRGPPLRDSLSDRCTSPVFLSVYKGRVGGSEDKNYKGIVSDCIRKEFLKFLYENRRYFYPGTQVKLTFEVAKGDYGNGVHVSFYI